MLGKKLKASFQNLTISIPVSAIDALPDISMSAPNSLPSSIVSLVILFFVICILFPPSSVLLFVSPLRAIIALQDVAASEYYERRNIFE